MCRERKGFRMKKTEYTQTALKKGSVAMYDFGDVKLHAYQTNDLLADEVFVVEEDGRGVVLESPCFFDNNHELEAYVRDQGIEVVGMLIAYHGAGASVFPGVPRYSTKNADEYNHVGGGKALVEGFAAAFGEEFDAGLHETTNLLTAGSAELGGIEFVIEPTAEAFDVRIPAANAVYTHMLGHDCHSIVAGAEHADALIAQLEEYVAQGYDLVLTSHYTPEDLKDVATKIAYLRYLKAVASTCTDADTFKSAVSERYPEYSGGNYLDMTAGFFFPEA